MFGLAPPSGMIHFLPAPFLRSASDGRLNLVFVISSQLIPDFRSAKGPVQSIGLSADKW